MAAPIFIEQMLEQMFHVKHFWRVFDINGGYRAVSDIFSRCA